MTTLGRSLSQCLKQILHKPPLARFSSSVTYPLQLASVSENHAALYEESLKNPQRFWGDLARRRLLWIKEFDQVMDCNMQEGKISWFNGGILNVTGETNYFIKIEGCVGVDVGGRGWVGTPECVCLCWGGGGGVQHYRAAVWWFTMQ